MDDVSLGGAADCVADVEIAKVGDNMGLILNTFECQLIARQGVSVADNYCSHR